MPGRPLRVAGLVGEVTRGRFAVGSKSEHDAVWIDTGERRLLLRRKEGPAMGDPVLVRYVGRRVRCDGLIVAHTLLAESIEVVDG
jgi:hypothetical protein